MSPSNDPPQQKEGQCHQEQQKSFHSNSVASACFGSPAHLLLQRRCDCPDGVMARLKRWLFE
jgi:hypothetical protein